MDTHTLKLWIWWSVMSHVASISIQLDKDVVELNTTANMTCTVQSPTSIYYDSPDVPNVAFCLRTGKCTSKDTRYIMSSIDANQAQLYISAIKMSDEGEWTCKDVNTAEESKANLSAMKFPSCNVNSSTDSDNLQVGDELSLSISLDDFYCYPQAEFLLQTGEVTEMFIRNSSVKTIESDTFNTTFNVTDSYIGSVTVHFICKNVNEWIPCGGVQELQLNNDIDSHSKNSSLPHDPAISFVTLGVGIGIGLTILLVVLILCVLLCCDRTKLPCLSGGVRCDRANMFTSCVLCRRIKQNMNTRRDRHAAENTPDTEGRMRGSINPAFPEESDVQNNQMMKKHETETKYTTETENKTRGNINHSFSPETSI